MRGGRWLVERRRDRKAGIVVSLRFQHPTGPIGAPIAVVYKLDLDEITVYVRNLPVVAVSADGEVHVGQGFPTRALADYLRRLVARGLVVIEARPGVL